MGSHNINGEKGSGGRSTFPGAHTRASDGQLGQDERVCKEMWSHLETLNWSQISSSPKRLLQVCPEKHKDQIPSVGNVDR